MICAICRLVGTSFGSILSATINITRAESGLPRIWYDAARALRKLALFGYCRTAAAVKKSDPTVSDACDAAPIAGLRNVVSASSVVSISAFRLKTHDEQR